MSEEPIFSWHHLPGVMALGYVAVKEMFRFLERIWPRVPVNSNSNGNGHVAMELKLGEVIRAEIKPLREDIRAVDNKLDDHIKWHLEKGE